MTSVGKRYPVCPLIHILRIFAIFRINAIIGPDHIYSFFQIVRGLATLWYNSMCYLPRHIERGGVRVPEVFVKHLGVCSDRGVERHE